MNYEKYQPCHFFVGYEEGHHGFFATSFFQHSNAVSTDVHTQLVLANVGGGVAQFFNA